MQKKGDRKLRNSTNNGRIKADMVKDMESFRESEDYLQTLNKPSELAEEDKINNLKVLKEFVESFGLDVDIK